MRGLPARCCQPLRLQLLLLVYDHVIAMFSALFSLLKRVITCQERVVVTEAHFANRMIAFFLLE